MIDISFIKFNLQSEFHMLRHFEKVNTLIYENLIREGYTQKEIDEELLMVGSKFNSTFATDISSLLKRFIQNPTKETIGSNGNFVVECQVSESDFPDGIGTKAVIPIEEISEENRSSLYLKKNRDWEMLHLKVDVLPSTQFCTLILKPLKSGYLFISAFPGQAALPIPSVKMDIVMFNSCKEFWDNHVFLELKKD